MLTLAEMEEACNQVAEVLRERVVSQDSLRDVAQSLESLSYDLALAVMESMSTYGDSREMQMARAAVQAMDERLTWVQRNGEDVLPTELWDELESAWQNVRNALRLLGAVAANPAACGGVAFRAESQ